MFKLVRYFAISSFIILGVTSIGLFAFFSDYFNRNLQEKQNQNNLYITQFFANYIKVKYSKFLKNATFLTYAEIVESKETVQLYNELKNYTQSLSIVKIEVVSLENKILFSTELREIGDNIPSEKYIEPNFSEITNDRTKISYHEKFNSFGFILNDKNIISSCILIAENDQTEFYIKLYSDITQDLIAFQKQNITIFFVILLACFSLYVILFVVIKNAEKILDQQFNARQKAESALRESKERYAIAVAGANDGLWDWNLQTGKVYFSKRWQQIIGIEENFIMNKIEDWFHHIHYEDRERFDFHLQEHLRGKSLNFECQYRIKHQNGHYLWVLTRGLALQNAEGKVYRMAGSLTNLTDRSNLFDSLTGFANRTLFLQQLQQALDRTAKQNYYLLAVIFIDCDRFKLVNDSLGHLAGDLLLVQLAKRLEKCLRQEDLIARLGGDEFIILLENIKNLELPIAIAKKINHSLKKPFEIMNHSIYLSTSIGIADSSKGYLNAEDLLRDSDTAMYHAKALGKDRYQVFDHHFSLAVQTRMQIETDLRIALENNQFQLYYQPIVSLSNNLKIESFEALIRWNHPTKGFISPANFIPIAEENGLIIPLGEWVIKHVCQQLISWQKYSVDAQNLTIGINLSRKQLSYSNLITTFDYIFKKTNIKPHNIKLEVTETALMNEDEQSAITMLAQLKELGIFLSIDDFGTGYSSLSCLHKFPLDFLKIDRSFVKNIDQGKYLNIVKAIINMSHDLGLKVIAEGIETQQQLLTLQNLSSDYGQGYLFAKPLPSEAITNMLINKNNLLDISLSNHANLITH